MKNNLPRFLAAIILALLSPVFMFGENDPSFDEKAYKELSGHASFNVVFVVIAIIFSGLIITLIRIDRKVSRLEKEMKGPKS